MKSKRQHIPGNIKNRKQRPHQGVMFIDREERKKVLSGLLQTEHLNNNTKKYPTQSLIEIEGEKYIIIHGYNINEINEKSVRQIIDIKQRYAATLKLYKICYNKIKNKYYPNSIPYNIQIPSILYFSHTDEEDIVVQKFIEGPTYEELYYDDKTSDKDYTTLVTFHNDRLEAFNSIGGCQARVANIKIKNKIILVLDDFTARPHSLTGDLLPPHGDNVICTRENDTITFRLTDAVMSRYIV